MSSRYVPPSKRGEKHAPKPIEINNAVDFPALSVAGPRNTFSHQRSFSALASEWNEKAEEDKITQEYREAANRRELEEREREYRNIVSFNKKYAEAEQNNYFEEQKVPLIHRENDGWTTVDRKKIMPELSAEQKDARAKRQEEMNNNQEDSVWVAGQSDADWGFRDRRAVQ